MNPSSPSPYHTHAASAAHLGASPWTLRQKAAMLAWEYAWTLLCRWTPKPLYPWRLMVLRLFGAKIDGRPFVHQRARIQIPWNIRLDAGACLGDGANLYSVSEIHIGPNAIIAQEAYLCTATHDFAVASLPLQSAPIRVEAGAFVGARAFVLPGLTIGAGAIVGACAVVTRSVPAGARVKGNPAR